MRVRGDRYAGEWPREQFHKRGIQYLVGDKTKSDLYRDLLPLLNSGRVVLPKSERLVSQICGLERRVSRAGKDSIDHAPGAHVPQPTLNEFDTDSAMLFGVSMNWFTPRSRPVIKLGDGPRSLRIRCTVA